MRLVAIHRPWTALLAAILLFVGTALIALPAEPAGVAGGQISGVVTNAAGDGLGGVFVYASGGGGFRESRAHIDAILSIRGSDVARA